MTVPKFYLQPHIIPSDNPFMDAVNSIGSLTVNYTSQVSKSDKSLAKKLIRITTVPMALRYLLPGQMKFMQEKGFDVLMISADGKELEEVIENEKCPHLIVPMTRKITPIQDLKCLFQLIKIFRREKPDIVHSHTPKAGLLGMIAAKICGVKIRVHTVAGLPMMVEKGLKFELLKWIEKITYACANHVWPNSESLLHYINKNKLSKPQKLNIIAKGSTNGINTEKFSSEKIDQQKLTVIKEQIRYSNNNSYLLCMGRLVKDKGIVELVNVFTSLQSITPSLKLILVGDFEESLDPLPEETINVIKNNSSIIHIKWTNDVEYYMHLADTFIFPSHREGFPNVLLQAGAMHLPIICSRIAGNIDIVKNNETGLLFDQGNEQEMKSLIMQAVKQKEKMKIMACRLKEIIYSEYQRNYIWDKILQQYTIIDLPSQSTYLPFRLLISRVSNLWKLSMAAIEESIYVSPARRLAEK